jgi:hypothetical protein
MSLSFIDPPPNPSDTSECVGVGLGSTGIASFRCIAPRRGRGTLRYAQFRTLILIGLGLVGLGWLLLPEPVLAQCAMCRATVTQSPEGREMSEKLNTAILVMFFAPYLVFGTVAAVLFRARITPFVTRVLRFLFLPR